jgi:hypothetical protein
MAATSPSVPPQVRWPCQPTVAAAFRNSSNPAPNPKAPFNAQQCEDRFFVDYFAPKVGGVYVELGALDGKELSNTLHLNKAYGWRGLLVEANPDKCAQLSQNRPYDAVACGAVCSERFGGVLSFVKMGAYGHSVEQGTSSDW